MHSTGAEFYGAEVLPGVKHDFLKAKFQIGSCKGPLNYSHSEAVFHPDDIPKGVQRKKERLLEWKRQHRSDAAARHAFSLASGSAKLGQRLKWNISVEPLPAEPVLQRSHHAHDRSNTYQYNFRAEVLPPKNLPPATAPSKFTVSTMSEKELSELTRQRTAEPLRAGYASRTKELPVHPNLEAKEPWDYRTVFSGQEYLAAEEKQRKQTLQTRQVYKAIRKYESPEKRTMREAARIRAMKSSNQFDPDDFYVAQKIEKARSIQFANDDEMRVKLPTINRIAAETPRKHRKIQTYKHSGIYEWNEQEGTLMWSDTASFEKQSPGDVVKAFHPTAFNFASY
eukprot:scaffold1272_cov250-Pinguiococcus_pyrenoidosus.AAC.78